MISPRGSARIGLGAAGLLFILSIGLIGWGAAESRRAARGMPGSVAADFTLTDTDGHPTHLADLQGSVVVVGFLSTRCTTSNDYTSRLAELAAKYANGRVKFLAVYSDVGSTDQHSPMAQEIEVQSRVGGLQFPLLLDSGSNVATQYAVDATPTFFVIDAAGAIAYRGALDDNVAPGKVQTRYLDQALHQILAGKQGYSTLTEVRGCQVP